MVLPPAQSISAPWIRPAGLVFTVMGMALVRVQPLFRVAVTLTVWLLVRVF